MRVRGPGLWREMSIFMLLFFAWDGQQHRLPVAILIRLPSIIRPSDACSAGSLSLWGASCRVLFPSSLWTACLVLLSILSWLLMWLGTWSFNGSALSCHYLLIKPDNFVPQNVNLGQEDKTQRWERGPEDLWRAEYFIHFTEVKWRNAFLFFSSLWEFHNWLGGLICFPIRAALLANLT